MMNSSKWILVVTSFFLANISLLGIINYIVDPFRVFGSNILPHQLQMNERFVKVEFLEKNHQKFNAYMFGSSRIGVTNPSVIEQYIPNSKFYNFTLSSATLYDYMMHLDYFIKQQYEIKTLYLQLDIDNMNEYEKEESDYLFKLHPYIENKSLFLYYMKYFVGFFPVNIKEKILNNIDDIVEKRYFLEKGIWTLQTRENQLLKNCKEYVKGVSSFHFKNPRTIEYTTKNKSMNALKKIVELCKSNHIKLYVFTSAHNQNMMDTFLLKDYNSYLRNISELTDFYDFSGYNSITTNNCNYYEISHYRPLVGKLIAARIFNSKKLHVPADFGKHIKKGEFIDKR